MTQTRTPILRASDFSPGASAAPSCLANLRNHNPLKSLNSFFGQALRPRLIVTDKGYDSRANRLATRARGITPIIPRKKNARDRARFFPRPIYRLRTRIEQTIGKLKRFKRIALRCDKTGTSFSAFLCFACALMTIKSVHTA